MTNITGGTPCVLLNVRSLAEQEDAVPWIDPPEALVLATDLWRTLAAAWLIAAIGLACLWLA